MRAEEVGRSPRETWKAEGLLLGIWCVVAAGLTALVFCQSIKHKYGFEPGDNLAGFRWLSLNICPILILLIARLCRGICLPCNGTNLFRCVVISMCLSTSMYGVLLIEPWLSQDITELINESYYYLTPQVLVLLYLITKLAGTDGTRAIPAELREPEVQSSVAAVTPIELSLEIKMGDIFSGIQNSTIINHSIVENAVNKVSHRNKEGADALMEVAKLVNNSKDKDAIKYFERLVGELAQPVPSKSFLKTCWEDLTEVLPAVKEIAGAVSAIVDLIG